MADILLVDNDRRIGELCAFFLEQRAHRVRLCTSYAEARERIRERAPELLLADLELGAESGRVELPRLAALGLLPPTLIVSGYLDRELERELGALPGVRGTLAKPFDLSELLRRVDEALGEPPAGGQEREPPPPVLPAGSLAEDEDGWIEILPGGSARAEEGG